MSTRAVHIQFKVNFPVVLITVMLIHALLMVLKSPHFTKPTLVESTPERTPLKIRDLRNIRTVGAKNAPTKENVYFSKSDSKTKEVAKEKVSKVKSDSRSLSLNDLAMTPTQNPRPTQTSQTRPGARPEMSRAKAISGINLKGNEMRQFAQGSRSSSSSGDPAVQSLSNSDVFVNLEVPEGVSPDELNKYELMFYGFQRRTAINYINSFYKNLDKFQQSNPHLNFPMTESKQVMTGRLTYDSKGNIKQIKMLRWTNVDKLQDFFLGVLKDMDTLHNPPTALWEKTGEFSIYFSFIVNG